MGAFEDAADVMFADDSAFDATWAAGGTGTPVAVRLLKSSPDRMIAFGQSRAVLPSDLFRVRKSEIAAPAAADVITLTDTAARYAVIGTPTLESRGLIWTCEAKRL